MKELSVEERETLKDKIILLFFKQEPYDNIVEILKGEGYNVKIWQIRDVIFCFRKKFNIPKKKERKKRGAIEREDTARCLELFKEGKRIKEVVSILEQEKMPLSKGRVSQIKRIYFDKTAKH